MKFLKLDYEGKNGVVHYLIGIILFITVGQLLSSIPLFLTKYLYDIPWSKWADLQLNSGYFGVDKNIELLAILLVFVVYLLVLWGIIVFVHKRSLKSYTTGFSYFRWRRMVFSFIIYLSIALLVQWISIVQSGESYTFRSPSWEFFLPLVLIALCLLPFQTAAEEIFVRGYLMQAVAIKSKSVALAILLPSLVFALLHGINPEVYKYGFWIMMTAYFTTALFFAVIAFQDNGLEIPIGFHTANNFLAAVFINYEGSALDTDALFILKNINMEQDLIINLILNVISLIIMHRLLKWSSWKNLLGRVNSYKDISFNPN